MTTPEAALAAAFRALNPEDWPAYGMDKSATATVALLHDAGYALTPLAPEVPPHSDDELRKAAMRLANAAESLSYHAKHADDEAHRSWFRPAMADVDREVSLTRAELDRVAPEVPPDAETIVRELPGFVPGMTVTDESTGFGLEPSPFGDEADWLQRGVVLSALAATRTPEPPDSASGTVAPWTGEYLPPILDQSQHEDRQVEPPARRIRPQGTITHQHNGWHDHPLVDLGDATAATEPHVHRRRAEPPDSGDGAAPVDLDRLAFALWEEFGGGQLDENDDRPPERLGPEHEYWPAAANRVLGTVRNINANIVRNIAAIAAIRSGSPAPEGGE